MAEAYTTNGSTHILIAGSGLGYSGPEGVKVSEQVFNIEVFSDEKGPSIPVEVIENGVVHTIKFQLYKADNTVLSGIRDKAAGGTRTSVGTAGSMKFAGNRTFTCTLTSPVGNLPRTYKRCYTMDAIEVSLSTQLTIWDMTIRCVPDASGVLFTEASS